MPTALHSPESNRTAGLREVELGGPVTLRASDEEGMLRAAFRDAHGARLNGFALLVTLGDEPLAASLAADALGAGTRHADELRHPERAASWLRVHVLKATPQRLPRRNGPSDEERRMALVAIGVDSPTYDTLASLTILERATLIASAIEGFTFLDLEFMLGSTSRIVRRRVDGVRRKFLERQVGRDDANLPRIGPLGLRVREIADQALTRHR